MRAALALVAAASFGPERSAFLSKDSSPRGRQASFLRTGQPVEQIVKYKDNGLGIDGERTPSVSAATWEAMLDTVVSAGESRFLFAADMPQVKGALDADLASGTKEKVHEEEFDVTYAGKSGKGYNLVSHIKGTNPDKFVVVGAHYDSIPAQGPAPGAEDNGSGAATLLTIAGALKGMNKAPEYSVEFVLFSAEEEGLLGSSAYVKANKARLQKHFQGAFILDEVSFSRTPDERLIFETSGETELNNRLIDTLAHSAKAAAPHVEYEVNYHGFGSDHMPFLQQGLPAVLVIERDNMFFAENYGHSPRDTVDRTTPAFGANVASLVAQAVWSVATAPAASAGNSTSA